MTNSLLSVRRPGNLLPQLNKLGHLLAASNFCTLTVWVVHLLRFRRREAIGGVMHVPHYSSLHAPSRCNSRRASSILLGRHIADFPSRSKGAYPLLMVVP